MAEITRFSVYQVTVVLRLHKIIPQRVRNCSGDFTVQFVMDDTVCHYSLSRDAISTAEYVTFHVFPPLILRNRSAKIFKTSLPLRKFFLYLFICCIYI